MNVGKSLASKVLAVCSVIQQCSLDAVCLQEIDVNEPSWPRVVDSFKSQGYQLIGGDTASGEGHLGSFRRCAIVSRMPVKCLRLSGIDEPDRAVAVVFEARLEHSLKKIILACTYGHAACQDQAAAHHAQVLCSFCLCLRVAAPR